MKKKLEGSYALAISEIMKYSRTSKHGLTDDELRLYLGDLIMKKFGEFIDGQTCMLTPDHKIIVYPHDIDRFVRNTKFYGPDLWD